MRLHTDNLTTLDILLASHIAGTDVVNLTRHGSRKRRDAFEVNLSGSGRHGGQWGNRDTKSATWDEWGIFLAELFRRDSSLTIPRVYEDREMFEWSTDNRYDALTRTEQHIQHRWKVGVTSLTGSYQVQVCKCGARRRFMHYGHSFDELRDVA